MYVSTDCDDRINTFLLVTIITDLLLCAYIAIRYYQYVRSNLKLIQSEQYSSKLIVWNMLRILMSSTHVNFTISGLPTVSYTIQIIIFIILSYVITFDVERNEGVS